MDKDPFKEYIKQSEPNKRDKGYAWHTAIGLQAVDGLKPSKYLIDTAIKNIEGDISIDEAQELLNTYYEENPKANTEDRTEEADKLAVRIAKILSEKAKEDYLIWYYSEVEYGTWKRCSRCGEVKLAHNRFFSKNNTSKDGWYSICKECRNSKNKEKN